MFVIKLSKLWSENFHCFCCCYCCFCSSTVPGSFWGVIFSWQRAKVLANLTSLYFLILLLFRLIRGFPFRTCNVLLLRIYIKLLWHKVSIEQASSGERKVLETMQKHFPGQLVTIKQFLIRRCLFADWFWQWCLEKPKDQTYISVEVYWKWCLPSHNFKDKNIRQILWFSLEKFIIYWYVSFCL